MCYIRDGGRCTTQSETEKVLRGRPQRTNIAKMMVYSLISISCFFGTIFSHHTSQRIIDERTGEWGRWVLDATLSSILNLNASPKRKQNYSNKYSLTKEVRGKLLRECRALRMSQDQRKNSRDKNSSTTDDTFSDQAYSFHQNE